MQVEEGARIDSVFTSDASPVAPEGISAEDLENDPLGANRKDEPPATSQPRVEAKEAAVESSASKEERAQADEVASQRLLADSDAGPVAQSEGKDGRVHTVKALCDEATELVNAVVRNDPSVPFGERSVLKRMIQSKTPVRGGTKPQCMPEVAQLCCSCFTRQRRSKTREEAFEVGTRYLAYRERVWQEWKRHDENNDGVLTPEEVHRMFKRLNVYVSKAEVADYMKEFDLNQNNSLDFDEFAKMYDRIQSLPDLRFEYLLSIVLGSGKEAIHGLSEGSCGIKDIPMKPQDLQSFVVWATNGASVPTTRECAYRLFQLSNSQATFPDPFSGWQVPEPRLQVHLTAPKAMTKHHTTTEVLASVPEAPSTKPKTTQKKSSRKLVRMFKSTRSRLSLPLSHSKRKLALGSRHSSNTGTGVFSKAHSVNHLEPRAQSWDPEGSDYVEPFIDYDTFVRMLVDKSTNCVADPVKLDTVYQDMTQPLSHYYISSSHNSYLGGSQVRGESSAEAIVRALKLGVRVIELDAWDGPNGEPLVTHGRSLCTNISFAECLQALKQYGFEASCYPVIITIENHCSLRQQKRQVALLREILGDQLLQLPPSDPANPAVGFDSWLSPEELKFKFVIRDRPQRPMKRRDQKLQSQQGNGEPEELGTEGRVEVDVSRTQSRDSAVKSAMRTLKPDSRVRATSSFNQAKKLEKPKLNNFLKRTQGNQYRPGSTSFDAESASFDPDEDDDGSSSLLNVSQDPASCGVTPELAQLMYIKNKSLAFERLPSGAIRFKYPPFCTSSSLSEQKMRKLAVPGQAVAALSRYATQHLIRVYPAGLRLTSSNYDPLAAWNAGCQMVALNYQSGGIEIWYNQGKFSDNGGCGYVLKPKASLALEDTKDASPATVNPSSWSLTPIDASFLKHPIVVTVQLLSGHHLPVPKQAKGTINPFVEITMRGLREDDKTLRSTYVANNSFNPTWRETFSFEVHNKDLALLSFVIRSVDKTTKSNRRFIAQTTLPLPCVRPGLRCLTLRSANWAPIQESYLFCKISIEETLSESPSV